MDLALKNLQTWMKDETVSTNLVSPIGCIMVGEGGSGVTGHRAACPRPLLALETKVSQSSHLGTPSPREVRIHECVHGEVGRGLLLMRH